MKYNKITLFSKYQSEQSNVYFLVLKVIERLTNKANEVLELLRLL